MFNLRLERFKCKTGNYGDGGRIGDQETVQLYERDQEYQQTPFHSRHSICQIYCEAEAHLLNLSIVCPKQRVCSIVLFVAYFLH